MLMRAIAAKMRQFETYFATMSNEATDSSVATAASCTVL
jgi:hypothetical protein